MKKNQFDPCLMEEVGGDDLKLLVQELSENFLNNSIRIDGDKYSKLCCILRVSIIDIPFRLLLLIYHSFAVGIQWKQQQEAQKKKKR